MSCLRLAREIVAEIEKKTASKILEQVLFNASQFDIIPIWFQKGFKGT